MDTLLFTPIIDDRVAAGKIASRIGLTKDAIPFDSHFNFFNYIEEAKKTMPKLKCILVDEAQFMTKDQVAQVAEVVDHLKLPVLTYGLRTNFLGELFEGSQYLISWAEELIEIKTICHCGSKAIMNARIDANGKIAREGEEVLIGGNDRYLAVCRKHYLAGETGV
jgi:thymidine kinase